MVEAKEVAQKISEYLNTFGVKRNINSLVEELEKEHPTLQQSFTQLCISWLQNLAKREYFDDRNKASVNLARKILQNLNKEDLYLPMI